MEGTWAGTWVCFLAFLGRDALGALHGHELWLAGWEVGENMVFRVCSFASERRQLPLAGARTFPPKSRGGGPGSAGPIEEEARI